jgi:hypothetical protein
MKRAATLLISASLLAVALHATETLTPLAPYNGPTARGVDTSTLTGKVMVGYQGWFNCEGDGADLGWTHWAKNRTKILAPEKYQRGSLALCF